MGGQAVPREICFYDSLCFRAKYAAFCDADPRFRTVRIVEELVRALCEKTRILDPVRRGDFAHPPGFTAN